jgi:hypothetical protein
MDSFIRVATVFALMVFLGLVLAVSCAKAQMTCNCGPNTQSSGSPANPVVQSIHPR